MNMALPIIFEKEVADAIIQRIHQLKSDTPAQWGTMRVDQMLAHCNVTYEMAYENKHPQPNSVMRFILKLFVKPVVVNEAAYKKSSQTAPAFIIKDERNFAIEQKRLIDYITKTQSLGTTYFEGKESNSFGVLNATEWNNMFYKHLDHHLKQFGV